MTKAKKIATLGEAQAKVYKDLAGRKRPVTSSALADKFGTTMPAMRARLIQLQKRGLAKVVGQKETGHRPANLWKAA